MRKSVSALLLLAFAGVCILGAAKKHSGPALKYLAPTAFAELPDAIVRDLQSRKCMIPQYPKAWTATDRINVVIGQFAKPGQKDWSVVCADATDDTLLVYANGADKKPGEIPLGPRENYLISGSVPKETLEQKYADQLNGIKPDHDAIGVTGNDNQTVVHYLHEGKWIALRTVPHQ
jgi:hypothetical protein